MHTPRFCGQLCSAGAVFLRRCFSRLSRTNWLIVGIFSHRNLNLESEELFVIKLLFREILLITKSLAIVKLYASAASGSAPLGPSGSSISISCFGVVGHAGAGRDQTSHDHVFFQPAKQIHFPLNRRLSENLGGFLEKMPPEIKLSVDERSLSNT